MNEEHISQEAPCLPGGNYGLCKTHPTCEMVQEMLKQARERIAALEAQHDEDALTIGVLRQRHMDGAVGVLLRRIAALEVEIARVAPFLASHGVSGYRFGEAKGGPAT